MKNISLLGSTGSIGTQTLDIVDQHPDKFQIIALSAGSNIELLKQQIDKYSPRLVSVATKEHAEQLSAYVSSSVQVMYGEQGLIEVAAVSEADIVVTAIMGSRGLPATLAAIDAGKQIGLANKETLVTAGHIVMERAKQRGVQILPIDSEHSAIFQCLNGETRKQIERITLTASGGSFRDYTREQLTNVSVEQALKHPNWSMGAKITIDSATMANKGLEVIEAHWLFDVSYEQIDVVIHPESIIHSYVEFVDRSVVAQLGMPDMRVPIQYALTYPDRIANKTERLSLAQIGQLNFRPMDTERYPMLRLAFECGKAGLSAPIVYNAANEVAVDRFLKKEISFLDIERVVETALSKHAGCEVDTIEAIVAVDQEARAIAAAI
ncbi:1-deoxy-D-xylulose 5-phosphate reductoisomerase 2 [Paenibacillus montaniterrae]|uniref:1-deoxy-D-xylulose 5-phosphate reductoisomerase n=1 Tax=Paenibacillus montaniterrae TaxID=429341 RepID=A0A919YLX5_9BACL|nr:1-deoxy-D-xylulose-5-phosphate reductoisomerase [Paenibacillus montaniterrae]GIP14584.1 1-deoxy-D-xylulose 5-phosphate reductoisomerase 2 [Paenibacillus montaniterrae]